MKLRNFLAAALCFCLVALPAQSFWQSRDSTYNQSVSVAANPTWTGTDSSQADQGNYTSNNLTFTGVNFGTASASRIIVVLIYYQQVDCHYSSGTIGGVSATLVADNSSSGGNRAITMIYAAVPTGTSGNVNIICTGSVQVYGPTNILVGALTGTSTNGANPQTFGHLTTPQSLTNTVPANGFMVMGLEDDFPGDTNSFTNGTTTYINVVGSENKNLVYNSTPGSQTITWNAVPGGGFGWGVSATFGP